MTANAHKVWALGLRPWPPTALALALILTASGDGAATQEAYVWQRDFSPPVAEALARGAGVLSGFHVLDAEVSWTDGQPQTWRAKRDWAVPAALRKPIGLVLRIGPYSGPFESDDVTTKQLVRLATEMLADARSGGVEPAELQIDFDCAESKLDGYREWLLALRKAVAPTRLVITVLPTWMNARVAFARLVAATDGFVLQVHSLDLPSGPNEPFVLCDPTKARAWAAQAGSFGAPFRIALPTYGYVLNFDAGGNFVSLSAEQFARPAPPGGIQRVVLSDAIAVAGLARELRAQPPPLCEGLIWFRLPVDGDQLNWAWPTFAKVVAGAALVSTTELAVQWPEAGLAEIVIVNAGDITERIIAPIGLTWPAGETLLATDALGGFRVLARGGRNAATIEPAGEEVNRLIAPGGHRIVAWFRFQHAVDLSVHFASPP